MSITINGTTGIAGVDGSAATPSVQGADANTGVFFPAADTVALTTGGSERLRVDTSGNVGIGTSSPAGRLDVRGGTIEFDPASGADATRALNFNIDGSNYAKLLVPSGGGGALAIWTGSAGSAAERMRIGPTGNVGIGTISPSEKLEVVGQIRASGSSDVGLLSITSGASIAYAQFQNSVRNWQLRNDTGGNFVIRDQTATTNRVTIDTSGNVGIGGSVPASNPKLSMYGGIRFLANETAAATYTGIGSIASDTVSISTSGTERLNIGTGGLITQINATSGAGAIVGEQTFQLTGTPAAIGPTIADFFGATSSISLEASSTYEILVYAAFLKTTASTVTWTMTASSAPTRMQGWFIGSPVSGIGQATIATGTSGVAGSQAATTAAFAATASLTTAVNHNVQMTVLVQTNAATNWRLQITSGSGTVTPLVGSYYKVKKISASTGTFVA